MYNLRLEPFLYPAKTAASFLRLSAENEAQLYSEPPVIVTFFKSCYTQGTLLCMREIFKTEGKNGAYVHVQCNAILFPSMVFNPVCQGYIYIFF